MSEEGDYLSAGIPPLRRVIDRPALLAEVLEHSSPVTVLAAPGGYGKTTIAAQVAHESRAPVVWLDCSGVEGPESLAALVRDECAPEADGRTSAHALLPSQSREECVAQAASLALGVLPARGWLVLDSIVSGRSTVTLLTDVLSFLRPVCRAGHRAIITTRTCELVPGGTDVAVLDAEVLTLNLEETKGIAELLGIELSESDAAEIHATTNGQVALALSLLGCARHRSVASVLSGEQGRDLSALLRGLVLSQMGDGGLVLFYAAALLRHGSIAQLRRTSEGLTIGLLELAASCVPLLQIEYDHGVPSAFVLHDLGVAAFEDVSLPRGGSGRRA